jgi:hypothetical protein
MIRNVRPVEREISRLNTAIDKVVVSDSLTAEQTAPWRNTRIVKRADSHEQLAALKRQRGKEILVLGVFEARTRVPLQLIDSRTLNDSELVLVRYGVRG